MSQLFIDGNWEPAAAGDTREVINPFDSSVLTEVAEAEEVDVQRAITAARRAFDHGDWPRTPAAARAAVLDRVADLLLRDKEELARTETLDVGKTLGESRADVDDVVRVLRYYAALADKNPGRIVDTGVPTALSRVVYEPVGVCGLITPWNYPLLQASWKLAPALAAGNTVVLKPSELTPLTTIALVGLFAEAGLPEGVLNLVLGAGPVVGAPLAESPLVDMVSFTGGLATGRTIMAAAAGNVKKVALELGGKNPNIVFADADLDTAVDQALNAVFLHAGQVCSAGARLIVQDTVYDRFLDRVAARAEQIRLGNGLEEDTESGPLISAAHRTKIEDYVESALSQGAKLLAGGRRPDDPALGDGFFYRPTVFADCRRSMRVVREETFGPILTAECFHTEREALELGNDTEFGLAAAVWTGDGDRAQRVAAGLRHGTVWINDYHPYLPQAEWGGFKQSGIGRELGPTGLDEYREAKHIYHNTDPRPLGLFTG